MSTGIYIQSPHRESRPLVSVIVPTYQHAPFITQCLDGILSQDTRFPIEILVGEDESTDGTREICQHYATAYPDRIRLFLGSRKDVMVIMGQATGRANLLNLLAKSEGDYLAFCEGDDYWLDSTKLQRQVDLLEAEPSAAGCFTNGYNEHEGERSEYLDGHYTAKPGRRVKQDKLVDGQGVPFASLVIRRQALFPLPECLWRSPTGDTMLLVHAGNFGDLLFDPSFTVIRNMHVGGIHSLKSTAHKSWVTLCNLPLLDEASHYKHHKLIMARRKRIVLGSWETALEAGHGELARYCWKELSKMRDEAGWTMPVTVRNYLKAYWPRTEKWIGGIRERLRPGNR